MIDFKLPGLGIALTLTAYLLARLFYQASNKSTWFQPVVLGVLFVLLGLYVFDIPYERYFQDNGIIHFLLSTATVALAIPLYQNAGLVRHCWRALLITLLIGGALSSLSAVGIAWILGASPDVLLSIAPKSVTTPFAIAISNEIGGLPGLAAALVIISGIIVAAIASPVFSVLKLDDVVVRGSVMGMIGHGIATARAVEMDMKTAAFSALSMGLMGIYTSLCLPWAIWLIRSVS
ncbi:MAG: LrgB family protein [Hahellaceae bacterium]|nr:LrgB family protein [Hahellaceae bacterium]MCP5169077.1 LrgB family protein [Hahellaceae bacterium]